MELHVFEMLLQPRFYFLCVLLGAVDSVVVQVLDWSSIRATIVAPLGINFFSVPASLVALELLGPTPVGIVACVLVSILIDGACYMAVDREFPVRAIGGAIIGNVVGWGMVIAMLSSVMSAVEAQGG